MSDLSAFLSFAHQLADAAARQTLPLFRATPEVVNKLERGFDPVTAADRDAETAMREMIDAAYPDHAILGEEHGEKPGGPRQWVLDPIDGTRAFITGMPSWGTLIALNNGTAVEIGMMDQPFTGERFFASADGPAMLRHGGQDVVLKTRACAGIDQAILATTSPDFFVDTPVAAQWQSLTAQARLVRYGGDCYNYALVAAGQLDAVVEQGLKPYDIQALIPLVERAGGRVSDWQGGPAMAGGQIVASGDKALHDALLAHLNG